MPNSPRPASRRAFALAEVLVVLAIILVLLALLLPVLKKARRAAEVLASPIAYVGTDQRVHLTDPRGNIDLVLPRVTPQTCPVCHSPPVWSPSGQTIAISESIGTAIINPLTNERALIPRASGLNSSFLTWADSSRLVLPDSRTELSLYSVETRRRAPLATHRPSPRPMGLTVAPVSVPFPYVGTLKINGNPAVAFFRSDLSAAKTIWKGDASAARSAQHAVIDPGGNYVAWTMLPRATVTGGVVPGAVVAIKPLNEPASVPPKLAALGRFRTAYFCDWTEQGTLLVNATENGNDWSLWIFSVHGAPLRRIPTPVRPFAGPIASWRKYGHR